jgi:hypothetical protein
MNEFILLLIRRALGVRPLRGSCPSQFLNAGRRHPRCAL